MAEPSDMVVPMLGEMRKEIADGFSGMRMQLEAVNQMLSAVEAAQKSYKQALTADSLLSKLVTGEFEQRIAVVEEWMRQSEAGE